MLFLDFFLQERFRILGSKMEVVQYWSFHEAIDDWTWEFNRLHVTLKLKVLHP